jgi:hypothetical protein
MLSDAGLSTTLSRLRVCRDAGRAPDSALLADAISLLELTAGASSLRARRNEHIRRAAALLDGSRWERSLDLLNASAMLARCWDRLRCSAPESGTVRGELHSAALLADLPESRRQFYRVLCESD